MTRRTTNSSAAMTGDDPRSGNAALLPGGG
jgi:hypothetical protein